jgi:hypothetical protein
LSLITGASAGIGQALARVYAGHGWDVALTARRADRLTQLADEIRLRYGVEPLVLPADLADPATPERLVAELKAQGRVVDCLVNNAGYSLPSTYQAATWSEHQALLQVMQIAPAELAHRVLPGMVERRFGRILNVASLAAWAPSAGMGTLYNPTKAWLVRFSQSLHLELRDAGVHVSALCPGYTYSEFHDVNGSRDNVSRGVPRWIWSAADEVARAGYEAAEANRAVTIPGAANKLIAILLKLMPDEWTLAALPVAARRLGRT